MPIFDQSYERWQGPLAGHAWRWWTITRHGLRAQSQNFVVRACLLAAWLPAIGLALALIAWGLVEQNPQLMQPIIREMRLPDTGLRSLRVTVWTLAYCMFLKTQLYVSIIVVLLVGPGLISRDLRFQALPLYFSRPLRPIDYIIGKFGVIGMRLGQLLIVPTLIGYVLGVAFSLDMSVVSDTIHVLAGSILFGIIASFSIGFLMLVFSSLSRNWFHVAGLWVGFITITTFLSYGLSVFHFESASNQVWRDGNRQHAELWREHRRVSIEWFEVDHLGDLKSDAEKYGDLKKEYEGLRIRVSAAQSEITAKAKAAYVEGARNDWGPLLCLTSNLERILETLLGLEYQLDKLKLKDKSIPIWLCRRYPWYWSAGILALLFGLCLWLLKRKLRTAYWLR